MLLKEDKTTMLPKSSSQKTLRAAMHEEREQATAMAGRLRSRDASLSNTSFRVYYGVASAGSVPFVWESAPGTPKNAISDTTLPPLTPPPSYYNNNKAAKKTFAKSQSSKRLLSTSKPASFVQSILPKLRRSHTMPSPSSSSSSVPSSKEGPQSSWRSRMLVSPRSSFSSASRGDDDDDDGGAASSPTSTLCFRTRHSGGGARRLHGLLVRQ